MKSLNACAYILIILLISILLSGCAANFAVAKMPDRKAQQSFKSNTEIIQKIQYDPGMDKHTESSDYIRKPDMDEHAEEGTLLNELPEIDEKSQAIKSDLIIGDDQLIADELKRIMLEFGEEDDEIPQVFFDEVKRYIRAFQINPQYRKFVTASLKRSSKYMPLVKTVFNQRGIPEDMSYIAFIESGFNQMALSQSGALGLWQFMPGTARNYSLRVGKNLDERLDPVKSTYAAVDYFHDLIAIFGPQSFLLAMAAYNSGEGKIISCLKEIANPFEERNFWHIRPCLAQETREYPPKIIASAIIGNSPEAFGFPRYLPESEEVIDPVMFADCRLKKNEIRPMEESRVLAAKSVKVVKTATIEKSINHKTRVKKPNPVMYTVKNGNTLPLIAEAFAVDIRDVRKWNKLKGDRLSPGAKLTIYPKNPVDMVRYTVRKGDTIIEISESFHVRPNHIVIYNGLKNGWNIKTGQNLVLYKAVEKRPIIYVVKKGSNLSLISDKFTVKVRNIMMWNNLSSTTLYPGQKLKIYKTSVHDA